MCILPIHSNGHSPVQTVDRNKRTTPLYSHHRASQAPHLKSASHLTVFSQLVRQPNSCVNHPYIQTAITQSRRLIETNEQRRSTAITEPHKHQISNLRHQGHRVKIRAPGQNGHGPSHIEQSRTKYNVDFGPYRAPKSRRAPAGPLKVAGPLGICPPCPPLSAGLCVTPHSFLTISEAT